MSSIRIISSGSIQGLADLAIEWPQMGAQTGQVDEADWSAGT